MPEDNWRSKLNYHDSCRQIDDIDSIMRTSWSVNSTILLKGELVRFILVYNEPIYSEGLRSAMCSIYLLIYGEKVTFSVLKN